MISFGMEQGRRPAACAPYLTTTLAEERRLHTASADAQFISALLAYSAWWRKGACNLLKVMRYVFRYAGIVCMDECRVRLKSRP